MSRHGRARTAAALGLLGGLVASQVAYGKLPGPRPPAETRRVLGLALATSAAEAWRTRGRRGLGATAVAGGVGLGAELVGVSTGLPFGRYGYSAKLGARVGGVPWLAGAAWGAMARPAWVVAGWGTRSRPARVVAAAAALTAWDVYLDPRMVREGYWSWEAPGAYEDVPASNFAGWFLTGLVLFSVVALVDRDDAAPRDDLALALYTWTWLGEAFANGVLWRRPGPAVAGAVAMGGVAVPALARRLGR